MYTIQYTAQCFWHFCLHKIVSGWNGGGNCFMVPRWKLSIQLFLWMSRVLFIGRSGPPSNKNVQHGRHTTPLSWVNRESQPLLRNQLSLARESFTESNSSRPLSSRKRANQHGNCTTPSNPCHILFYALRGWDKWLDIFVQFVIHFGCNATAYNKKATPVRNCAGV